MSNTQQSDSQNNEMDMSAAIKTMLEQVLGAQVEVIEINPVTLADKLEGRPKLSLDDILKAIPKNDVPKAGTKEELELERLRAHNAKMMAALIHARGLFSQYALHHIKKQDDANAVANLHKGLKNMNAALMMNEAIKG